MMKKNPGIPPAVPKSQRNPRQLLRTTLILVAFLFSFILLDVISAQFEGLQGIVTWYPASGLTYTLLLVFGVIFTPAVTIVLFISSVFVYHMPQPVYLLFLWAFIISLINGVAALFLRKLIHFDWQLRKLRDVTWLIFTVVIFSALLSILSVSSSAMSSDMAHTDILRGIFDWWIGETVGILTLAPFLLIFVMPGLKRFVEGQPGEKKSHRAFSPPSLTAIAQLASIVLTLYWVLGSNVPDEFRPIYLLALPLIWIALQRGLKGVSIAILLSNIGIVLALWLFRFDLARLGELELLMIINCIVGLIMGALVTERKRIEEEILKLNSELEMSVEERTRELREAQEKVIRQEKLAVIGQLAGGVGHELRNPLAAINNAVYYLTMVQPDASEKIQEYHAMITQEVHNAEKIINDLLGFTRKISADRGSVSLPELVKQVLKRFPPPSCVKVTLDLPADLPRIFADGIQIEQVLGNLTLNACQAMPEGGELTISAKKQKKMVAIAIQDTGTGISPENMKKLFEPLFTTKIKGIGLGLAVCRKLVEANEGRIEVKSEPGKGSTFTILLPVHEE